MNPFPPAASERVQEPTVRDVMHHAHCTLAPTESLARAHEKMHLFRVSELAVVDGAEVVGILTTRALHRVRASSRGVKVADIMSAAVVTVDPLFLLRDVARVAGERAATHVAVVHHGVLIGTFSIEEMMRAGEQTAPKRENRRSSQ